MNVRIVALALVLAPALAACMSSPPPPPPESDRKADGNPLENTVLDTQGRALQKAKDVQNQVKAHDQAQRQAIEDAGG